MTRRRQVPSQSTRVDSGTENTLEGWAEIIQEQGRQMRGEVQSTRVDSDHANHGAGDADGPRDSDCSCRGTQEQAACSDAGCGFCRVAERLLTIDDSGLLPTEREVQEMNAPGEPLESEGVETPADRCSRGLHEQVESEPWRCVHSESHVDLDAPNTSRLIVVFCSWLVAERETHNWILKQRRRVESGTNAGKYTWREVGFYGTPGQAATRALHLMTESAAGTGGLHLSFLVKTLVQTEERLRGAVEQAAATEARARALREALAVVKDEKDRERIQKLMASK